MDSEQFLITDSAETNMFLGSGAAKLLNMHGEMHAGILALRQPWIWLIPHLKEPAVRPDLNGCLHA